MKQMYLNRAMAEAVAEEMARDERVVVMGEDLLNRGGGMSIFMGIPAKYPERCVEMPIAESGYSCFANGAAYAGHRPVVDLMFSDFSTLASNAIICGAAHFRFSTMGKESCPVVYMLANGGKATYGGAGYGCNHSECIEAWFQNVAGLKILAPYYPADVKGLLKAAIRDDDPVLFLYHAGSIGRKGEVPEEEVIIPINKAARVIKEGKDVTIVAIQSMVPLAEKAAVELAAEGIDAEVIDPRVLVPLDEEKIVASVKKTGRLVIVHEAHVRGGFGGEIAAIVSEHCVPGLKAPIKRVGSLNSPISSGYAEELMMPHVEDIVKAVKSVMS